MQLFRIFVLDREDDLPLWEAGKPEAHITAKTITGKNNWDLVRIEMVKIFPHKDTILGLLQGRLDVKSLEVLKTWRLSPRGALKQIVNGE